MVQHIHVNSIPEAWEQANRLFPSDYEQDSQGSANAGYPIYRSTSRSLPNAWYNYICDLGNRLELNLCGSSWKSETINIWIDQTQRTSQGFRVLSLDI